MRSNYFIYLVLVVCIVKSLLNLLVIKIIIEKCWLINFIFMVWVNFLFREFCFVGRGEILGWFFVVRYDWLV